MKFNMIFPYFDISSPDKSGFSTYSKFYGSKKMLKSTTLGVSPSVGMQAGVGLNISHLQGCSTIIYRFILQKSQMTEGSPDVNLYWQILELIFKLANTKNLIKKI